MGLKHLPFVTIVFLLLNIFIGITFGGKSLSGRLRCVATLALARDQGKGVARLWAYK